MNSKTIASFRQELRAIERILLLQNRNEAVCCGVTLAQCHAVLEIGSADGLGVKDLSARLGLDKSTLSRTVDTLVRDGLAERTARPGDRRSIIIRLTPQGLASARRINSAWDRICADMFRGIPAAKHRRIIEAMGLISGALAGCTRGFTARKQCCE